MRQTEALKEFTRYVGLSVLGMLSLSCYILADTFFVSYALGTNGLAALNLAIPVYSFVHGSGLLLGVGGATKYSLFKGRQENKGANEAFTHTLVMALLLAAACLGAGLFLAGRITALLGANEAVFPMARTYLQVILLFAPAFILNDVFLCFVRGDGNPRLSMLAMAAGSVSNILLDYLFLFPLRMGIFGAVLATGLAAALSVLILSAHLKRKERFRLEKIKPSPRLLGAIAALGVPSLIAEVASGTVMILFNFLLLQMQGNVGVAAYGVIANLSLVAASIYTGIAQGMQPLVSRAYGGGSARQAKKLLRWAMTAMLAISALVYTALFLFAEPVAALFNREGDAALQRIAVNGLRLYFSALPFLGFNVVLAMFFTAVGRAFPAQAIAVGRGLVVIVPAAFLLARLAGLTGLWLAVPITESIVALGGLALYGRIMKKRIS